MLKIVRPKPQLSCEHRHWHGNDRRSITANCKIECYYEHQLTPSCLFSNNRLCIIIMQQCSVCYLLVFEVIGGGGTEGTW